jgi:hypothetical protein
LQQQLSFQLDAAISVGSELIVVHGACPTGGDQVADEWAQMQRAQGMPVIWERHPAEDHPTQDFGPWPWCGPKRNRFMARLGADVCIAVIGPCTSPRCKRIDVHGSHGATGCAEEARKAGIPVRKFEMWK